MNVYPYHFFVTRIFESLEQCTGHMRVISSFSSTEWTRDPSNSMMWKGECHWRGACFGERTTVASMSRYSTAKLLAWRTLEPLELSKPRMDGCTGADLQ